MTVADGQRSGTSPVPAAPLALDLADLGRQQAASWPEHEALTFEGATSTYHDLDHRATRVANGLLALRDAVQGRVAPLDKNSDAFYEVRFGAAKIARVTTIHVWRHRVRTSPFSSTRVPARSFRSQCLPL